MCLMHSQWEFMWVSSKYLCLFGSRGNSVRPINRQQWSGYRVLLGWPMIEAYSDIQGCRCCSVFGSAIYGLSKMSTAFLFQAEDINMRWYPTPRATLLLCHELGPFHYRTTPKSSSWILKIMFIFLTHLQIAFPCSKHKSH